MKWLVLVSLLLTLCGCGAKPVWEVVEDLQPAGNVTPWQETAYDIHIALPQEADLIGQHQDAALYEAGNLEIMTSRFLASDYTAAVEYLSGYEAERLNILQTTRFDLPEYQFAWYSETEEGGRMFRADFVMDGMTCYAVVCSAPEAIGDFMDQVRPVFSTFGLLSPDSV